MQRQTKIIAGISCAILVLSLIFAIWILAVTRKHYRDTLKYGCRGETPCLACRTCRACRHCHELHGTCGVNRPTTAVVVKK